MRTKNFQELKATGALPSPPGVGLEILRITSREDCSIDRLAAAIQVDPVLTSRLLQVANTSSVRGSQACTTIQTAAMRLGLRAVRAIALGFSLVSGHRAGRCPGFDYDAFWSRSLARAVAAAELAARFSVGESAEVFVAGLLSDIGTLALATAHPAEFAAILTRPEAADPARRAELEQQRLGIDHAEAGAAMLAEWQLPDALTTAVATVHTAAPGGPSVQRGLNLATTVWLAARFAAALTQPSRRATALAEARRVLESRTDLPVEQLAELWVAMAKSWRRWGAVLDILTTEVPSFEDAGRLPTPSAADAAPPADPAADTSPAMARGHAADGEGAAAKPGCARVLAVDDDPVTLRLLQSLLEREGHRVTTAGSADAALRLAFEDMPQILICDRNMPGMDGVELVRRLRQFEAGRRVYAILLTADDSEEQAVSGLEAGADDYLVKPFRPRLLMARVRAALRVLGLQEQVDADRATMAQQVAEQGVLVRRLEQAAITDQLTGIHNRRFAMERLREEWARAYAARSPLSVLLIDIDRFKRINDLFGHAAGDVALTTVARALAAGVTAPHVACRLGGEEFVVLLPGTDLREAKAIAESLRAAIAATPVRGTNFECLVTASFGVATATTQVRGCEQLLGLADQGCYLAKNAGRNQVRSPQDEVVRRPVPRPVG